MHPRFSALDLAYKYSLLWCCASAQAELGIGDLGIMRVQQAIDGYHEVSKDCLNNRPIGTSPMQYIDGMEAIYNHIDTRIQWRDAVQVILVNQGNGMPEGPIPAVRSEIVGTLLD